MRKILLSGILLISGLILLASCDPKNNPSMPGDEAPCDQPVFIKDPNLEWAIRVIINKPNGVICKRDAMNVKEIVIDERVPVNFHTYIWNLEGLEEFENLEKLHLRLHRVVDLKPLENLHNLKDLDLSDNRMLIRLKPIENLTNLERLWIPTNKVEDLTPLQNLTNLTDLNISSNYITDITPLTNLVNLRELRMSNNMISDITPIANMTHLVVLWMGDNNVSNINVVSGFPALEEFWGYWNPFGTVAPLGGLVNLREINVRGSNINSIAPLAANPGIGAGDKVALCGYYYDVRSGQTLLDTGNSLALDYLNPDVVALRNRDVIVWSYSYYPSGIRNCMCNCP